MSKFHFDKKKINSQSLLVALGNNAVNYFKVDVFDNQAWEGKAWKKRKIEDPSRKILVGIGGAGRMRESIRVIKRGSGYIQVGTDVPYAQYHNQGTDRLPKRQFIGKAKKISEYNERSIQIALKKSMDK